MLNHFRTLLLNESYFQVGEHIPDGYVKKTLPAGLVQIYNALYPGNLSRQFKLFLTQCYLNILDSTDNTPKVLAFDKRVTYDLNDSSYFHVDRWSVPALSNGHELKVVTGFSTTTFNDYVSDEFTVSQVSNTAVVTVFSKLKNKYLTEDGSEFATLSADCYITLVRDNTANSSDTYYKPIKIGRSGAEFIIIDGSSPITSSSGTSWTFLVEGPYTYSLSAIISSLESLRPFDILKKVNNNIDLKEFERTWENNPNKMYRFAALLLAYITIVNAL